MATSQVDWGFIAGEIMRQTCAPVIGNQMLGNLVFGDFDVVRAWAEQEEFPLADRPKLTRVAEYTYLSITRKDAKRAKTRYLDFLKEQLLERLERNPQVPHDLVAQVRRESQRLSFTELAGDRLRCPDLRPDSENPLSLLATLDFPIFLTTSPHRFIEAALVACGKTPRTEVYAWREDLEDSLPAELRPDTRFIPSVGTPLVFHLHGIEDEPDSLVLTEEDYLDFLISVVQDLREVKGMPSAVRNAVSHSLLLLLGYHMHAWDLRVLFRGMMKNKQNRPRSFAVQLASDSVGNVRDLKAFRKWLADYFDAATFDIYEGPPDAFVRELSEAVGGRQ